MTRFVLASASPARLATLCAAGVEPDVIVSGIDEDAITAAGPVELVAAIASAKATAVAEVVEGAALVLGCDSMLEFGGAMLGKPHTREEVVRRWQDLRGGRGVLHTGHCLIDTVTERSLVRTASTGVAFADVTDEEIGTYADTGEPQHVAGAFTLDGLGGWFVDAVDGDPHNVVGVSLPLLRRMLAELGRTLADLGYPRR